MATPHVFAPGMMVRVHGKRYVRGSRGPGRPARYTYPFHGEIGVLVAPDDPRPYATLPDFAGLSMDEIRAKLADCLAYRNATGVRHPDGLTDNNNIVEINGQFKWVSREQIRRIPTQR